MARPVESEAVPGAGAGASSFAPTTEVVGGLAIELGETAPIGAIAGAAPGTRLNPQLLTEGAETWQAEGRSKALVTFNVTPN